MILCTVETIATHRQPNEQLILRLSIIDSVFSFVDQRTAVKHQSIDGAAV